MAINVYNPSAEEINIEESEVPGQPRIHENLPQNRVWW